MGANVMPLVRGWASERDEPMVISVVAAEYKVERVLIDQGSLTNILYWSTMKKMQLPVGLVQKCLGSLYGFAGECVPILGTVELETSFGERSASRTVPVLYTVIDALASYNIIIGRPTLNKLGAIVSTKHLCMKFRVGRKVGSMWANTHVAQRCYEDSLKVERSKKPNEQEGPHPVEDLKEIQLGPKWEQIMKIGTAMSQREKNLLISLLKANYDVFAWSAWDMPGVDPNFMCHQLSIEKGEKPVAQKEKEAGGGKERGETRKLLSAGFVREVQDPTWLANVVMVKKPNDKWTICTNYTDLNKACPKDSYPLPSIDRLDEEKTTFITDEGAFCYKVMPFDLKNAGATYQRLMDKIFKGILGTDVEVYVDDMVVKSQGMEEHCEALGRVFHILKEHQL
ncbi:Retrovirus-related Pol polyprotein, partial [Mucuna pruriens]